MKAARENVDAGSRRESRPPTGLDLVQETSEESFPASDAPAWTPVTGLGPPAREEAPSLPVRNRGQEIK
jgi:hypothetical protein